MDRKMPFILDTRDKKVLGVCSGIGNAVGIDPTFVRIAWVAIPLLTFVTVWQAILAYVICGIIGAVGRNQAEKRSAMSDFERMEEAGKGPHSIHDLRTKLDETDRRMMAIDHHLNSTGSDELAREIEALRKEKTE